MWRRIVKMKLYCQRETSEERSNLKESRGTSSLLKSSQQTDSGSSKMAAAGFCLKIKTNWYRLKTFFSDWDAIGINFAETSLRWQVTNLIQFSICLSVLRFVTTSPVNFCNLYKIFKKTMIFFSSKLYNIYTQQVWFYTELLKFYTLSSILIKNSLHYWFYFDAIALFHCE